jgi:hypothetical protein
MTASIRLPAAIMLVPGRNLAVKLVETQKRYPHLPELAVVIGELNRLNAAGGVPIRFDNTRQGNRWFRLYTARASIGARQSNQDDAWVIEFVEPLRLRDHAILATDLLRVTAPAWRYHPALTQIPPGYRTFRTQLEHAWATSQTGNGTPAPTAPAGPTKYDSFCDDLDVVIEAGRQIDAEKQRQVQPIPYHAVESAAERRPNAAGTYVFRLARKATVERGALVELRNAPDLRGTVRRLEGDGMTVRFVGSVDRQRIAEQGELVASTNPIVARVQANAVDTFRSRMTVQSRLPQLLVDVDLTPYQETAVPEPAEPLDPDQLVAFRRALAKPDALLVLGPPGTGKTRTIVQIAHAIAARGERVLITSHTNTAVDNVLERLPDQVRGLRVGNEDRIAPTVRHHTLPVVAATLRAQIHDGTAARSSALEPWLSTPSPAQAWLDQLERHLTDIRTAQQHRDNANALVRNELQRIERIHRPRLDRAGTSVAAAQTVERR